MIKKEYGIIENSKFSQVENMQFSEKQSFVKHYSDKGNYILQVETNIEYSEAIDLLPCKYTYVEVDKKIETKLE